jgi:hypothetical protein
VAGKQHGEEAALLALLVTALLEQLAMLVLVHLLAPLFDQTAHNRPFLDLSTVPGCVRGANPTPLERVMGIEPTWPAWKAGVLPLNYTRGGGMVVAIGPSVKSTNAPRRTFAVVTGT